MKVIITIEDQDDGSVKIVATPNVKTMIEATRRGPMAQSDAVAYAMAMLTKAARDSADIGKLQKKGPQIILPPGIRDL